MALFEVLDRYERDLTRFLEAANGELIRRAGAVYAEFAYNEQEILAEQDRERAEGRAAGLAEQGEVLLESANRVEEEIGDSPEQLAALMASQWLAAMAGSAAAAELEPEQERAEERTADLREQLLADLPADGVLRERLADPEVAAERTLLQHALEHDLPNMIAAIRGIEPVLGGAVDQDTADALDATCERIVERTTATANSMAGSVLASIGVGALSSAIDHFANAQALSGLVERPLKRLREVVVRLLEKATALARKLIGNAALDEITAWLKEHVGAVLTSAQHRVVRRILGVDRLISECQDALSRLSPAEQQARLARVEAVRKHYDRFDGWGGMGLCALRHGAGWLAGVNPLLLLVPVVAITAYTLWIGVDHLDWPSGWPLPDLSRGLRTAVLS